MTAKAPWSETLTLFAGMFIHSVIIAVAILAVDAIAFLWLNRLTDLGTWVPILLIEGVVLMLLGMGGAGGEHEYIVVGHERPSTIHISGKPSKPWLAFRLAIAGFVLFVLSLYLFSQHYYT